MQRPTSIVRTARAVVAAIAIALASPCALATPPSVPKPDDAWWGVFIQGDPQVGKLDKDRPSWPIIRGLAIEGVSGWSRRAINVDAVVASIVDGAWSLAGKAASIPEVGDRVARPEVLGPMPDAPPRDDGSPPLPLGAWRVAQADEQGSFADLRGRAHLLTRVRSDRDRVIVLEARGHGMVYANGEPRMGDPYAWGFVRLPVLLREGENTLLFAAAGRGPLTARLREPLGPFEVLSDDVTLPDVTTSGEYLLGVPIMNATREARRVRVRTIEVRGGAEATDPAQAQRQAPIEVAAEFTLPPLTVVKLPLRAMLTPAGESTSVRIDVEGISVGGSPADSAGVQATATLAVPVRGSGTHRVTRTSAIDASVQYYAVVPPPAPSQESPASPDAPALVLSLHGASVEASSQAASYAAKPGFVIVAPTNRRPFGFDWEDWGRTDALEALAHARARFGTDPRRQHVTGHSMGGHGSWQLGVQYPDRFATIAPSAGWLSFKTYMSALGQKLEFVGASTHADAFARAGRASDTPALMDRLRGRTISILHGDADDNVPVSEARAGAARLRELGIPFSIHEQPGAGHWWDDDTLEATWSEGEAPPRAWGATCTDWKPFFDAFASSSLEAPAPDAPDLSTDLLDRNALPKGSIKRAFANNFVLVYATHGTPEENARSYAKARYDAEVWWVIGNGHAQLVADRDLNDSHADRNWIIYGTSEANRAWVWVPATVRVSRGRVTIGPRTWQGDDLGALVLAPPEPLPDGRERLVAIVAGTGPAGDRALHRLNYFQAGAAFPQELVVRSSVWTMGMAGVEHAAADAP